MATSFRLAGPGKTARRWLAGGTAVAIVMLGLPTAVVAPASANNNFGPFEIDEVTASNPGGANLVVNGPDAGSVDWNGLAESQVSTLNDNTAGNQDDTTFTNGSAEYSNSANNKWPKWVSTGATNAADKTDIGRVAVYTKSVPNADPTKPDRQYAYIGFDRGSSVGTGKYVFEFNQNDGIAPGATDASNNKRSVGDVRFIVWEQGSGGLQLEPDANNPDAGFFKWVDPDSTVVGTVDSDNDGDWVRADVDPAFFKGAVSKASATVTAPWWISNNTVTTNGVKSIPSDKFVEAGFDLTGLGAVVGCPSQGFSRFNMRSLTGTGNGNLKDLITPLTIDVPSTCATMKFTKTSPTGTALPGTEITITPNPTTGSGSLTVTTGADGTVTVTSVKPGTYTISETKAPLGYILVPWTQTVTLSPGQEFSYTFVNPLGDVQWTKKYEGYTAQSDYPQNFTGQTFRVQRVDGVALTEAQYEAISGINVSPCASPSGPAGCWQFDVADNSALDADKDFGKIRVNSLPVGTYTITELLSGAPTGFGIGGGSGTATVPNSLATAPTENGKVINYLVTAARDGAATTSGKTFENPRLKAKLSVKKLGQPGDVLVQGAVFDVYKVVGTKDATPGSGDDTKVGQVTTGANGIGTTDPLAWGESYYFVEISVPAPWNLPDNRVTNAVALTAADATNQAGGQAPAVLTVNDPKTVIVTDAQDAANLPAASITDTATVSGIRNDAGGTVTFRLYGPFRAATGGICVSSGTGTNLVSTTTKPLGTVTNNSATVTSDPVVVSKSGFYYWVAEYSGDPATGTRGATGVCGDPLEITEVTPAKPGISTVAGGDKALPSASLNDVATVTGLNAGATGTVTFTLYAPGDTTCATAVYTTEEPLGALTQTPNTSSYFAKVTATATTVNQPGTWRWIASYSGDDDNAPAAGKCNDANENWDVDKATTGITTSATPEATLPNAAISDSATVTGLTSDATGTVTFTLYGPVTGSNSPAVCTTQVGSPITVSIPTAQISGGSVTVSSGNVTVQVAGAYNWVASYSGDANNKASAGKCGDTGETSIVKKAKPTIVTTATDGTFAAGATTASISDTAVVSGLAANATGTITFEVFGPYETAAAAEVCGAASFTTSVVKQLPGTNSPNGSQTVSASFDVPTSGYYAWKATYSGDANNLSATHDCGEQTGMDEISYVAPRQPAITTVAVNPVNLALDATSVDITDTATLTGLTGDATGDVIFSLYGPSDTAVCEKAINTSTVSIDDLVDETGKVVVTSGKLPVTAPGTYWWIASYVGDRDNLAVAGVCGEEKEKTLVTQGKPDLAKVVQDTEGNAITGAVTVGTTLHYVVTAYNLGTADVTDKVVDTLPLGLGVPTNISNDSAGNPGVYAAAAPGSSYSGTITWNEVTVKAGDTDGFEVSYDVEVADTAAVGDGTLINRATWAGLEREATVVVKWITLTADAICAADGSKAVEVGYTVTSHNFGASQENLAALVQTGPFDGTLAWSRNGQPVSPATVDGSAQSMTFMGLDDANPVTGTLYWPGTTVAGGSATDWPGWSFDGTKWTYDANDPALQDLQLTATSFGTGATVTVVYDRSTECAPPGIPLFEKDSPTQVGSDQRPNGNVVPGETVQYVLTLTNNGGTAVTYPLTDVLPVGVDNPRDFTGLPDPDITNDLDTNQITLDWGPVTVAASSTITVTFNVTVTADPDPGTTIDLENNATWGELPGQARHIVVGPGVEIVPTLEKTADPETGSVVKVGDVITYTVKVGNNGNVPLTGDLVDTLPAGIEVVGNYTRDDGNKAEPDTATTTTLTWNDVTVQPGQVVTFTYDIEVLDSAQDQDSLVNTAEWLGLKAGTEHTVTVPTLPQTGLGANPLTTVGWAAGLLLLGVAFLLMGRRREEGEQA